MLSSILVVGCGSGETTEDTSKTLPAAETTADASKPASSTNAGTQAPATPQ